MDTGRNAQKGIHRRQLLTGVVATAALITCEAVSPAATKLIVPTQACGCPRKWAISFGHTCTVHDDNGKRWEDYTFDDVVKEYRAEVTVCKSRKDELTCYACPDPSGKNNDYYSHILKRGERGVWEGGGGEEPEYEFYCAEAWRRRYLDGVMMDWIDWAYKDCVKESGLAIANAEFIK